jgi:Spc97 / Spc98 family.
MKGYNQAIIEINNESKTFLEFHVKTSKLFQELNIIHNICFSRTNTGNSGVIFFKNCVPKSGLLINSVYNLLISNQLASNETDLLKYLFEKISRPFLYFLSLLIFKCEQVEDNQDFFIKYDNASKAFVIEENLQASPLFLHGCLKNILQTANNMKILKDEEIEYFQLCKDEFVLKVSFDTSDIQRYQESMTKKFMLKYSYLQRMSYDVKIEEEKRASEKLQKRLLHLRKIKKVIRN